MRVVLAKEHVVPEIPKSLAGVGLTAVGVALIRARESLRSDRLFDDPYAHLFADAAEADFLGAGAPPNAADSWARMQDLVERFYDGRVVATRYFDEYLLGAVDEGCGQVVDLGAGLDTRALRLALPDNLPFFEVDQPAMFDFKEMVLSGQAVSRRRVIVPTDLCGSWLADLTAAGFDPGLPTAWLEEGVLAYLSPSDATAVLDAITETATRGSKLAKAAMAPPPPDDETYKRMRAFVGGSATPSAGVSGVDRDNAYKLADQGWSVRFDNHDDLAAKYGRPNPTSPASRATAQYVTATRL